MATQGGASRLAQMQMRFQQKQQQEREQRRQEMTGPLKPSLESGDSKTLSSNLGPGKVRQMFDERRQRSTGIDKSYPLKPIAVRSSSGTSTAAKTRTSTTTTTVRKQVGSVKQVNGRISSTKNETKETAMHTINGHGISSSEHIFSHESIDNEEMPDFNHGFEDEFNGNVPALDMPDFAKLNLQDENYANYGALGDRNNNSNGNNSRTRSSENIKLKPVVMKKTAPPQAPSAAVRIAPRARAPVVASRSPPTTMKPKTNLRSPPSSASSGKSLASRSPKMTTSPVKAAPRPAPGPVPENMVACKICGRHFNNDRITKHQEICEKTAAKKRKIFDAAKHRVQGTEVEQYVRKGNKTTTRAPKLAPANAPAAGKKSNWRRKHEEFIAAIRAAKEMQAHLARGGKVSDLPPPPPSENPDYVECPHCHRRFNEGAASRHIPKCATMLHNKPKPGVKPIKKR